METMEQGLRREAANARRRAKRGPSKRERAEFAAFCRNATAAQLCEIEIKENRAGRRVYGRIARAEFDRRA